MKVDKILAIDPAGAIFDHHPPEYRLSKDDATVVHALHTSSGFYGLEDAIADVDFYPNGLWENQPLDCPSSDTFQCGCPNEWSSFTVSKFPWFYHNMGMLENKKDFKTSFSKYISNQYLKK